MFTIDDYIKRNIDNEYVSHTVRGLHKFSERQELFPYFKDWTSGPIWWTSDLEAWPGKLRFLDPQKIPRYRLTCRNCKRYKMGFLDRWYADYVVLACPYCGNWNITVDWIEFFTPENDTIIVNNKELNIKHQWGLYHIHFQREIVS